MANQRSAHWVNNGGQWSIASHPDDSPPDNVTQVALEFAKLMELAKEKKVEIAADNIGAIDSENVTFLDRQKRQRKQS